jgi:hypothetical protein
MSSQRPKVGNRPRRDAHRSPALSRTKCSPQTAHVARKFGWPGKLIHFNSAGRRQCSTRQRPDTLWENPLPVLFAWDCGGPAGDVVAAAAGDEALCAKLLMTDLRLWSRPGSRAAVARMTRPTS